jgi:hypothetical protein
LKRINEHITLSVNRYEDLQANHQAINAWKAPENFVLPPDFDGLANFLVVEIYCKSEVPMTEEVNAEFWQNFGDLLAKSQFQPYLVLSGHRLEQKKPLRSYKGLLPADIKSNANFLQSEIVIRENESLILAMVELNEKVTATSIGRYFGDASTCCVVMTKNSGLFHQSFLESVARECIGHKGQSMMEYFSLCSGIIDDDTVIARVSGDWGEHETGVQFMVNRAAEGELCKLISDCFKL